MVVTTTAVSFILLALGLGFCGWRFLRAFKKRGDGKAGFLLSLCFLMTALHNGILGFGALFFAESSSSLYLVALVAHFALTLLSVIALYTLYYIFFPKKSSYPAIIMTTILSAIGFITSLKVPVYPYLTPQNGVDWNMNFTLSLTTFYLLLISLSTFFYIFFQILRKVKNSEIRLLSFVITASALIGIANVFIRLIIFYKAPVQLRTGFLDVGIGLIGLIFILAFIVFPIFRDWLGKKIKISNLPKI